jgi:enoyl-CoA hydratase/carnithine racemase
MALQALETLLYSVEDGVATVTLNRPDKLNAFTTRMRDELIAVFDETDADDAVRAVIITGAGRGFCAGADLSAGGKTFDYASRSESAREESKVGEVYRDASSAASSR